MHRRSGSTPVAASSRSPKGPRATSPVGLASPLTGREGVAGRRRGPVVATAASGVPLWVGRPPGPPPPPSPGSGFVGLNLPRLRPSSPQLYVRRGAEPGYQRAAAAGPIQPARVSTSVFPSKHRTRGMKGRSRAGGYWRRRILEGGTTKGRKE